MNISGATASAIAQSTEQAILREKPSPGTQLPSVRALADRLGVSPGTVAAAYRILRVRGLAVGNRRRGTCVALHPGRIPTGVAPSRQGTRVQDLASGDPDPELLPEVSDRALRLLLQTGTSSPYSEDGRVSELLAFASSELEADGVLHGALTVTGGAFDGIERLLREVSRPHDAVAVEDPCSPALRELLTAVGLTAVPVPVDDEGVTPEGLDQVASRIVAAVITPRAQNPMGAALSLTRAAALRQVLGSYPNVVVIENDYLGPVAGVELHSLSDATRARWAFVRSVTKWLGPELRLAVVAGDSLTIAGVERRLHAGPRWVSRLLQRLAHALWSDPASGRRLARVADVYVQRRSALLSALAARGIAAGGRSGFHVWVPVEDETGVVSTLETGGWAVAPGARFRYSAAPGVRITTSALDSADAERLADALADALGRPQRALA